jgi:hypothetical protein
MGKNDDTKKSQTPAAATTAQPDPNLPPAVAPPPPGIFDELATFERATAPQADQRHTLGAWCRAKGVKVPQVKAAIKAGRLSGALSGDGPLMTEAEFDAAVDFRYANTFGDLPHQRIHVPAEQARQGGTSRDLSRDAPTSDDNTGDGGVSGEGGGGSASGGNGKV